LLNVARAAALLEQLMPAGDGERNAVVDVAAVAAANAVHLVGRRGEAQPRGLVDEVGRRRTSSLSHCHGRVRVFDEMILGVVDLLTNGASCQRERRQRQDNVKTGEIIN
jgi:hypothetical protein